MSTPEQKERETDILVAVAGVIILLMLAFHFFQDEMIYGLLALAWGVLKPMGWIIPSHAEHATKVWEILADGPDAAGSMLTWNQAWAVATQSTRPLGILAALPLFAVGGWIIWRDPPRRFRRSFNMVTLLERNARVFPAVRPIVGLNLVEMDFFKGPWRVPHTPFSFALHHGLLERKVPDELAGEGGIQINGQVYRSGDWAPAFQVEKRLGKRRVSPVTDHRVFLKQRRRKGVYREKEYRVNTEKAEQVFTEQLGEPLFANGKIQISKWQKWPPRCRALMAAFLLIGFGPGNNVGREAGMKLLVQFNDSFYHPDWRKKGKPEFREKDLDMTGVNQVLAAYLGVKYRLGKGEKPYQFPQPQNGRRTINEIRAWIAMHGFLNPLMLRLLEQARSRGILVTADFIWLRPIDRTLHYTLNNLGRENIKTASPLVEGAGALTHFMIEDSLGRACIEPQVSDTTTAFVNALANEGWIPGED